MIPSPKLAAACISVMVAATAASCAQDRPQLPASQSADHDGRREPHEPLVETPKNFEASVRTSTGYHASLGHGAQLYLPARFAPRGSRYDLVIHFHGAPKHQETAIEQTQLNAAVVSVNLGTGTDSYAHAFRSPESFERLLDNAQTGIERSGHANGASRGRLALTAWSAGFVAIAKILGEPSTLKKIDAILLADGFYTSFTDPKKRLVNTQNLEKFVRYAEAAMRDDKLFAITHTTIPTGPYPSVQECVAKLLELCELPHTPSSSLGPRNMHALYAVDRGSFHVHGYDGLLAGDHVKQLRAMADTLFPYLKERWDGVDTGTTPSNRH